MNVQEKMDRLTVCSCPVHGRSAIMYGQDYSYVVCAGIISYVTKGYENLPAGWVFNCPFRANVNDEIVDLVFGLF